MPRANDPWLSVIVPWYSRLDYVRRTLESMACQTDQGFECLIVDQGRDETLGVVEEYRGRFDFRVILTPEHADWVGKTNAGFRAARGSYVCMLHTDDVWRSDRIATLRAARARHPQAGLLFHSVRYVDSDDRTLGLWRAPLASDRLLSAGELLEHLIVQNFIACPAPVMRRELLGEGIDPALWYTGDWELYLRVGAATSSVYLDAPLADFRLHTTSLTMLGSRSEAAFRQQLERVVERCENILPEAERTRLLEMARFSNAVNVAFAGAFHGRAQALRQLVPRALGLGWHDLRRYLQDSRIVERASARALLAARARQAALSDSVRTAISRSATSVAR